jgi:very-short-patch-repair endonuclease
MKKGSKHSEESKLKLSKFYMGKKYPDEEYPNHGMRNKHHSLETRKKMSEAHLINPCRYWLGKHPSEETKRKRSESIKAEKHPLWGKKHSEETRKKMSEAHLGKTAWNKGISPCDESKKKMSESQKKRFEKEIPWNKGKIGIYSKETLKKISQSRLKQVLPIRDSSIEIKIQNFLKQIGINFFTHQYIKEIEHGYQCDILIPSMNLVIECDGDYWHKYPVGREIDNIRTSELLQKGFGVLRLWEHEINEMSLDDFKKRVCI